MNSRKEVANGNVEKKSKLSRSMDPRFSRSKSFLEIHFLEIRYSTIQLVYNWSSNSRFLLGCHVCLSNKTDWELLLAGSLIPLVSCALLLSNHTGLLLRFIYVAHLPSNANLARQPRPNCLAAPPASAQCGQPAKQPRLTQILQDITVKATCVSKKK